MVGVVGVVRDGFVVRPGSPGLAPGGLGRLGPSRGRVDQHDARGGAGGLREVDQAGQARAGVVGGPRGGTAGQDQEAEGERDGVALGGHGRLLVLVRVWTARPGAC